MGSERRLAGGCTGQLLPHLQPRQVHGVVWSRHAAACLRGGKRTLRSAEKLEQFPRPARDEEETKNRGVNFELVLYPGLLARSAFIRLRLAVVYKRSRCLRFLARRGVESQCFVCLPIRTDGSVRKDRQRMPNNTIRSMHAESDGTVISEGSASRYNCQLETVPQQSHTLTLTLSCPLETPPFERRLHLTRSFLPPLCIDTQAQNSVVRCRTALEGGTQTELAEANRKVR